MDEGCKGGIGEGKQRQKKREKERAREKKKWEGGRGGLRRCWGRV